MNNVPAVYNSIEIGIWAILGIGFVLAGIKYSGTARTRCWLTGFLFMLFSASDAVELHTGAWWKPWWLFAWKALCVISLLGLYIENVLSRVRRAKQAPSDGE